MKKRKLSPDEEKAVVLLAERAAELGEYYALVRACRAGRQVPRSLFVLCGDRCIEQGKLDLAYEAYRDAADKEKLVFCGDRQLQVGKLDSAAASYRMAESKEKLILCGNRYFEMGELRKG